MVVMQTLRAGSMVLLLQVLDGVFLGELAAVVRADVLLELVERLLAQVVAVHQEEDALGPGELDEAVAEDDGGEASCRCRSPSGSSERGRLSASEVSRFWMLSICTRQSRSGVQRRHLPQQRPHLLVERGEADQLFGPVEGEDFPAAGVRLQGVRELRDGAGGFVGERQRQHEMRQVGGQAVEVLAGLRFDAGEGVAFRLGLDDADGLGSRRRAGSRPRPLLSGNSRTATPRPAEMFISL